MTEKCVVSSGSCGVVAVTMSRPRSALFDALDFDEILIAEMTRAIEIGAPHGLDL